MSGWFFRYHFLRREELEAELFNLCLRLRRSRSREKAYASPPGRTDAPASHAERIAIPRHVGRNDCADIEYPREPGADAQVSALFHTLHEAAVLLHRLTQAERGDGYVRS